MGRFIIGLIYCFLFLLGLVVLEVFSKRKKIETELSRKIAHMASGLFAILMAEIFPSFFILYLLFFQLVIIISYKKNLFKAIHNVKRKTYGEIFLPLGILSAFVLSSGVQNVYLVSALILTFSDSISGFFSNIKLKGVKLGSILFFLVSLLFLLLFFPDKNLFLLIFISLLITLVEKFSVFGLDNLTIPFFSTLLLKYFL